ncbi:uncharacterized protein [Prorops nasuta]|uniref:uncharacterized protein n=1 Tax=Prorops nasuta TaxID=863751 RepID=UPI0034CF8DE4
MTKENSLPIVNVVNTITQSAHYSDNISEITDIKYLQKRLMHTRNQNNNLTSKLKREKLLRLKAETQIKALKIYKKKYDCLTSKLGNMPIIKELALGLTNPRLKWSPECLKLATQIRYAVGWKAYLYLKRDLKLPLPSYSTLCRRISRLDFNPGVLKNVILLMEKKRKTYHSSHQSDCVPLMDEMDIQKTLEYDVSTV